MDLHRFCHARSYLGRRNLSHLLPTYCLVNNVLSSLWLAGGNANCVKIYVEIFQQEVVNSGDLRQQKAKKNFLTHSKSRKLSFV